MMSNTRLRIRTTAAVTALLGVVLVGQAAAGVRPDDRTGSRGGELSTEVSYPDFVDRFVASHKAHSLRPDDRSNVRGPGLSGQVSYPDFVDRFVASHRAGLARTAQSSLASPSGDGFDWGAAGIGASTITALLLALGAAIGIVRRSRTRSAAA